MRIFRYNPRNKCLHPEFSLTENIWFTITRDFEVTPGFTFKEDICFYVLYSSRPYKRNRVMLEYFNVWRMRNENLEGVRL